MKYLLIVIISLLPLTGNLLLANPVFKCLNNDFFAFDNGTGRDENTPFAEQAGMLADLGYDGLGYTGTSDIPGFRAELESRGLTMYSAYVGAIHNVTAGVEGFKDTPGVLWVWARDFATDEEAVTEIQRVADQAAADNVDVVLYPHFGDNVATTRDALRLRELADRQNVYVSFNLSHWLRQHEPGTYVDILGEAIPWLKLVSVNGADSAGTNWDTLIRNLGDGTFEVYNLLKELMTLGYEGPIGLQGYNIPGENQVNLGASMDAWQGFEDRMKTEGCVDSLITGCMDSGYVEFDPTANVSDSSMCLTAGAELAINPDMGVSFSYNTVRINIPGPHSMTLTDIQGKIIFRAKGRGTQSYPLKTQHQPGLKILILKTPGRKVQHKYFQP